jgi:hypothetical protein
MSGNVMAFDLYILHRKSYAARLITLHRFIVFFVKKKDKGKAVPLHAMWAHGGQQRYSSIHS